MFTSEIGFCQVVVSCPLPLPSFTTENMGVKQHVEGKENGCHDTALLDANYHLNFIGQVTRRRDSDLHTVVEAWSKSHHHVRASEPS